MNFYDKSMNREIKKLLSKIKYLLKQKPMEKTLKLTDKEARLMYKTASPEIKKILISSFGEKFFSADILERIKDFSDICIEATEEKFMQKCKDDHLPDHEIANRQIELISETLNEGEELDYDDGKPKYQPIFEGGAAGFGFSNSIFTFTSTYTGLGSRNAFVSKIKSDFAGRTFTSIYKRAIIKKK